MDYETDDNGHLTSAHLTTDGGRLSVTLAPGGVVIGVTELGLHRNGIEAATKSIHLDRSDVEGLADVLVEFIGALDGDA